MSLSVVTPAATELLSSSDAVLRQHLRLEADETDQDSVIDAYCAAARDKAERYIRRRLITQTLRLTCDGFPCGGFHLGVGPVQSIEEVAYRDDDEVWQTVASSVYRLIDSVSPAEIGLRYGQVWPVASSDRANVRAEVVVGYGVSASDVPAAIVQAVRLLVAHMFHEREPVTKDGGRELPLAVRDLLDPYRVFV